MSEARFGIISALASAHLPSGKLFSCDAGSGKEQAAGDGSEVRHRAKTDDIDANSLRVS